MARKTLYPRKEFEMDYKMLFLFITMFALLFFLLGIATMHYPSMAGVI